MHKKILFTLLVLMMVFGDLQAGTRKSYPSGYLFCVFDRPATMRNTGSKLVMVVQDPTTHRWGSPPFENDATAPRWPLEYVDLGHGGDEIYSDEALTIKKPVTIAFCNFKGGEIDVDFSTMPKRIKHYRKPPWH